LTSDEFTRELGEWLVREQPISLSVNGPIDLALRQVSHSRPETDEIAVIGADPVSPGCGSSQAKPYSRGGPRVSLRFLARLARKMANALESFPRGGNSHLTLASPSLCRRPRHHTTQCTTSTTWRPKPSLRAQTLSHSVDRYTLLDPRFHRLSLLSGYHQARLPS
jgi:hypothetical protein